MQHAERGFPPPSIEHLPMVSMSWWRAETQDSDSQRSSDSLKGMWRACSKGYLPVSGGPKSPLMEAWQSGSGIGVRGPTMH